MAEVGGIKSLGGLEVMMVNDGTQGGNERRREEIIIRQPELENCGKMAMQST
jgi:hypothetical protein